MPCRIADRPGLLGSIQRGPSANAGSRPEDLPFTPILENPSEGFFDLSLNSFRTREITPSTTEGEEAE